MSISELPIPPHFDPEKVGAVWKVAYEELATAGEAWAQQHEIEPSGNDRVRVCLVAVDVQNTFCIPGFELFVGGRSGQAAVEDNRRLCRFVYKNLGRITQIVPTLDTHQAIQVFHSIFFVDDAGRHPPPYTQVSVEDVAQGRWKFNPAVSATLGITPEYGQEYLEYYTRQLQQSGKYQLTVWPYHALRGGIGYALVSAVEEAFFFHSVARRARLDFHVKGAHPLTEHYSALGPEVSTTHDGKPLAEKTDKILRTVKEYDAVIIAGQAKSHCVAWTVSDLLEDIAVPDKRLAEKIYLLEDCTSPVVVAGGVDFTEPAKAAFARFARAGAHIVQSTQALHDWPGFPKQ
jgi:nicotinamidase-related amidase